MKAAAVTSGATHTGARGFEELLQPVLAPAYRAAYHLLRNRADAEAIVQEAALLAWRSMEDYRPETGFRAWFHRIATRVFLSRYGGREDSRARLLVDELSRGSSGSVGTAVDVSRLPMETVTDVLQSLPLMHRIVLVLYLVDELSYAELAFAVGQPVESARTLLHQGRRTLRRCLTGAGGDCGSRRASG